MQRSAAQPLPEQRDDRAAEMSLVHDVDRQANDAEDRSCRPEPQSEYRGPEGVRDEADDRKRQGERHDAILRADECLDLTP